MMTFLNNLNQNKKIDEIALKKIDFIYDNLVKKNQGDSKKFELSKFLKLYFTRQFIINLLFKETYPVDYLVEIIVKSKNLVEENGSKFYFVYLPDHYRYLKNKDEKYMNYDEIIKLLNKNNIRVIDLHKNTFSKVKALKFMDKSDRGYNHYNEKEIY